MSPDALIQWDWQATLWLNQLGSAWSDPFWLLLSHIKIWFPAYGVIMGVIIWKLGWRKGLAVVLSFIVMVVLIDQSANLVKDSAERLRPCYNSWMIRHGIRLPYGVTGHLFGFFSGHAANSFGFAATSFLGFRLNDPQHSYRAYGWGVFVWAALMSVSRVMLGAHFLGDILVGALFGTAMGAAIAFLTHYIIVKARL